MLLSVFLLPDYVEFCLSSQFQKLCARLLITRFLCIKTDFDASTAIFSKKIAKKSCFGMNSFPMNFEYYLNQRVSILRFRISAFASGCCQKNRTNDKCRLSPAGRKTGNSIFCHSSFSFITLRFVRFRICEKHIPSKFPDPRTSQESL